MRDARYSTARWQRLRLQVLARDGYVCRIQGPRCRGRADTVHHIHPSSQRPELFWHPDNLQAACRTCNFDDGAYVKADNQRNRRQQVGDLQQQVANLEHIVQWQEVRIEELADALARHENGPTTAPARKRAKPAIY